MAKQVITLSLDKEIYPIFKEICLKYHIKYSMMFNLLMKYAIAVDGKTNLIEFINQELIQ